MSIFGAIKLADDLEEAVITTLRAWFETYMKEFELQAGLIASSAEKCKHPMPKSWLKADQIDREAADALPAIVVVSPGLSGRRTPKQEGDGTFRAFFSIGIGVFVGSNNRSDTMKLVRVYTAIIRTIMLQKRSLGGFADGSEWLDESYDDAFPFTDSQTISAGQVVFEIEVAGVVSRYGGPAQYGGPPPDPDPVVQPGSEWPIVLETSVEVGPKP